MRSLRFLGVLSLVATGFLLFRQEARSMSDWDQWMKGGEKEIQAQVAQSKIEMAARDKTEIPGAGDGMRCIDFGRHTRDVPEFDPMGPGCLSDPLSDPARLKSAWAMMVQKLEKDGTPLAGKGRESQKGLGRGNLKPETLDDQGHWGDLAYLYLKKNEDGDMPVGGVLVTYRNYRITDRVGPYYKAQRLDFQADSEGNLVSVMSQDGLRFPDSGKMMWGPISVAGDPNSMSGVWVIRWHQLLKAWTEGE